MKPKIIIPQRSNNGVRNKITFTRFLLVLTEEQANEKKTRKKWWYFIIQEKE
jgi:hypothetical protein